MSVRELLCSLRFIEFRIMFDQLAELLEDYVIAIRLFQAHPDQGRKSCQHTHRVKAELDERNTELGRLGSDADIATHSHAESSANRWAVDGSDYRIGVSEQQG